jgi:catechol 2,3-dioxygenase
MPLRPRRRPHGRSTLGGVSEQAAPASSPPHEPTEPIDPRLEVGAVTLAVSDIEQGADFYSRVLGLRVVERGGDVVTLGADGERATLTLRALADAAPVPVRSTGLFHVAWLHPTRAALADTVHRIAHERWQIDGASDHGVSEAIYLSDPDGLGIEIYADRPQAQWETTDDGAVRMFTVPLDLEDLLAQSSHELTAQIAPATHIGHVHLKVSAVPRAIEFYRDALGFSLRAEMPSAAFLAAGGYHHHVGANSWQSAGAPAAPASAPGVRLVEFELGGPDALDALERRLAESPAAPAFKRENGTLSVADADGHALAFVAR